MAIFRHPDGSYHRFPPHTTEAKLEPIKDRPGWYRNARTGAEKYIEPTKPPIWTAPIMCARLSPAVLHAAAAVQRWRRGGV
jgi:hypothetical protein